jgi:YD repeat-containing protein
MIDPNFDPSTIPLGYTYDNGRVLSYRDEWGIWCAYTRDAAGRAVTWITSDGYREDYAYDEDGKRTITRTREVPYAA